MLTSIYSCEAGNFIEPTSFLLSLFVEGVQTLGEGTFKEVVKWRLIWGPSRLGSCENDPDGCEVLGNLTFSPRQPNNVFPSSSLLMPFYVNPWLITFHPCMSS